MTAPKNIHAQMDMHPSTVHGVNAPGSVLLIARAKVSFFGF